MHCTACILDADDTWNGIPPSESINAANFQSHREWGAMRVTSRNRPVGLQLMFANAVQQASSACFRPGGLFCSHPRSLAWNPLGEPIAVEWWCRIWMFHFYVACLRGGKISIIKHQQYGSQGETGLRGLSRVNVSMRFRDWICWRGKCKAGWYEVAKKPTNPERWRV